MDVAICAGLALDPGEVAACVDDDWHGRVGDFDVDDVVEGVECNSGSEGE